MSAELYPPAIWERFDQPRWVLPPESAATEMGRAETPASAECAVLYRNADGRFYWRAHAGPWLVAALDVLCATANAEPASETVAEALNALQLPPLKRYCRAMADELWQASQHA